MPPGFPEKIEGIGWSVIVMESRSDRTRKGVETPRRRRHETSRRGSIVRSYPTIESLESRILLSGTSEPNPPYAFMGPPPVAPALIVPLAALPLAAVTTIAGTVNIQPLADSVSGPEAALSTPRLGVLILAPESSMRPVMGGTSAEVFGAIRQLSGFAVDGKSGGRLLTAGERRNAACGPWDGRTHSGRGRIGAERSESRRPTGWICSEACFRSDRSQPALRGAD